MLTYFISGSNEYTIRTDSNTSTNVTLSLQDMTTLDDFTASLSGINVNSYESMLGFTASISGAVDGEEYRASIKVGGITPIWYGSVAVFASQSVVKSNYENQVPLDDKFLSHTSSNQYIIIK